VDVRDFLSNDGQALLALCSAFGGSANGPSPLTLSEWNELEDQLRVASFPGPASLQGMTSEKIADGLAIVLSEAERIAALLDRAGRLAMELEGGFSRGMWAATRVDQGYPRHLRATLKQQAPAVIFGSGETHLLERPGIAIVGSRNIDEAGVAFAREAGKKTVEAGLPVVSGGARGTDRHSMDAAMEAEGKAVGVLADSLEATIKKPDVRELVLDGRLVLLTPYAPTAGFSVGGAMGRNKVIYGLAEFAVVVSSELNTGGTWAGAVEALKGGWCPVFVRAGTNVPEGNRALVKKGAKGLTEAQLKSEVNLAEWLRQEGNRLEKKAEQRDLFAGD
jgi:predicted Rossmann fold nucleotide-binding protein DprA/Smf involved in DNA uptake